MNYVRNRRDLILRLPELAFWFDGQAVLTQFTTSAGATKASDGVEMGLWRSRVGNYELAMSTDANRPLAQALPTNELYLGAYFDTSAKRLQGNTAMEGFMNTAMGLTSICLTTIPLPAASGRMFQFERNAAGSAWWSALATSGAIVQNQTRRLHADSPDLQGSVATYTSGEVYVRIDTASPDKTVTTELYHPSTGLVSYISATAAWGAGGTFDAANSNDVWLGGNPGTADPYTLGLVWEWVGCRAVLTQAMREDVAELMIKKAML